MPLTKLQFRPGINKDFTSYSNEGGWRDGDKVRFYLGYPEKIGGWNKYSDKTYQGTARALHNWVALDGSNFLGMGTHLKYYIEEGGEFNDVTPIRTTFTSTDSDNCIQTTDDSSEIQINISNHGCVLNDFITVSGSTAVGGISADNINTEHQIIEIIDDSSFKVLTEGTATSTVAAGGGTSISVACQLNVGLDTTVGGTGWGAGLYGGTTETAVATTLNEGAQLSASDTTVTVTNANPGHQFAADDIILVGDPSAASPNLEFMYITAVSSNDLTVVRGHAGTGASSNTVDSDSNVAAKTHSDGAAVTLVSGNNTASQDYFGWGEANSGGLTTTTRIRLWSEDNFGEDLLINPRDSKIYYWDKSNGISTRAVELNTRSGTKRSIPTIAKRVLVSDQDRHVIAFGCDGIGGSSDTDGDGVQDPLLIRFSDQEDPLNWYPATDNTAGDLRLGSGSTFVTAVETKREILVFTDTSIFSMRYIGPPFTFGLTQLAASITIAGPNAAAATEDFVFWMGVDNFYVYAGQTQQLPCTVKDHVFTNLNPEQTDKITVGVNSEFSEVWWFYPSLDNSRENGGDDECDKYVIYNYREKIWYIGSLQRTAWIDRGTRQYPIAAHGGYLYNHEFGYDDDGSAMTSFIESANMDIGDGHHYALIQKVIPDITFTGSNANATPSATFEIKSRNNPGEDFGNTSSGTTTRTSAAPVEKYTSQINLRSRGRSFALKVSSASSGTKWKLGSPRADIRQDGRR